MIRRMAVAVALATLVVGACSSSTARNGPLVVADPNAGDVDYDYFIAAGTGERFDNGEFIEILPAELEGSVGEVLRIVNADDRDHLIGPFFVGAGETLIQRFASPGSFGGLCTIHPSGQFRLTINP